MLPRFLLCLPIAGRQEFFEVFEVHPGRKVLFKEIQEAAGSGIRRHLCLPRLRGSMRALQPDPFPKSLSFRPKSASCAQDELFSARQKESNSSSGQDLPSRLTPCFPIGISVCLVSSQITPCFVSAISNSIARASSACEVPKTPAISRSNVLSPQNSFFFKNRRSSTASVPLSKSLADSFARASCSGAGVSPWLQFEPALFQPLQFFFPIDRWFFRPRPGHVLDQ